MVLVDPASIYVTLHVGSSRALSEERNGSARASRHTIGWLRHRIERRVTFVSKHVSDSYSRDIRTDPQIVSYEPRAKLGDWSFPTAREQPFAILGLGFYRPSAFGCDYEDPRCGVYVVADHGTHLDVGEVLGSGEYNVSSKPFPLGTATGVTAFNQNIGAFYVQMEVEKAANGGTSLVLVTCTLPSGELSSAAVANGYRAVALEFSEARSTLAGVFTADPPQYLADGRAVYHVGVLSPNGTVTIAGPGVSPTAADGKILVGVSAWQPLVGPSVGAITVLFESDSSTGSAPLYEVVSVNPWTGEIVTRASLDNPGQNTILQLGFA